MYNPPPYFVPVTVAAAGVVVDVEGQQAGGPVRTRTGRCVGTATPYLGFIRCSFTSRMLCTNPLFFHPPRTPALPTLVQYYCMIIGQDTTPVPTSR